LAQALQDTVVTESELQGAFSVDSISQAVTAVQAPIVEAARVAGIRGLGLQPYAEQYLILHPELTVEQLPYDLVHGGVSQNELTNLGLARYFPQAPPATYKDAVTGKDVSTFGVQYTLGGTPVNPQPATEVTTVIAQ
jgi:hypothetical protein